MEKSRKTAKLNGLRTKNAQQIFEFFEKHDPRPQTELIYSTNFSFLVAVMLSAQATDKSVNKIMAQNLKALENPDAILAHDEQHLADLIKSINYYKTKARHIYEMSKMLIDDFSGEVPLVFDDLLKLHGVGSKTARVVLNVLAGTSDIGVDTHVFRVSRRLGLSRADTPEELNEDLYEIIPQNFWNRVNHWLVLHGRYVCSAQAPKCEKCHVRNLCPWHNAKSLSSDI
ncbi:MAG: endonuclease III [Holosporales bacterium]|nr:endonuclease III [Holosporales bacterium]